jgi:hypothetical protein
MLFKNREKAFEEKTKMTEKEEDESGDNKESTDSFSRR